MIAGVLRRSAGWALSVLMVCTFFGTIAWHSTGPIALWTDEAVASGTVIETQRDDYSVIRIVTEYRADGKIANTSLKDPTSLTTEFQPGTIIPVRYLPGDPFTAVVDGQLCFETTFLLCIGVVALCSLILIGRIIWSVRDTRHEWAQY